MLSSSAATGAADGSKKKHIASSRPKRAHAAIVEASPSSSSSIAATELVCGWLPWTPVVKSLVLMMALSAAVTVSQFVFAVKANSKSLLADDATMVVDTFCYMGNIIGEASTVPSVKQKLELVFALISIVMLIVFNTIFFLQVWDVVVSFAVRIITGGAEPAAEADDDSGGVNGGIVLFFGFLGLVCDIISISVFYANAKKEEQQEETAADEEKGAVAPKGASVNLVSALLHVGADMLRSLSTTVEGTVLLFVTVTPQTESLIDSVATMFICVVVYICAAYAFVDWLKEYKSWAALSN